MDFDSAHRRVLKPSKANGVVTENPGGAAAGGQEKSPLQALTKAVEDELRLPKYRRLAGTPVAAKLAEGMLGCLNPPELDFTALSNFDAKLLATFPPEMWAMLRRLALAQCKCEITSVTLSAALSTELVLSAHQTLVEGLRQLPGLAHLTVVDPPAGSIDLRELNVVSACLAKIQIRCPAGPRKWELYVPQSTVVFATANSMATEKSTVHYYDANGQCGEPRTLGGIVHAHQAGDGAIRLNGVARLGQVEGDADEHMIWCRHLAIHWLRMRQENRSTDEPFDYGPFETREGISATMKPDTEADVDRIHVAGVEALFEADHFGKFLAQQFGRMQIGETRQLLVETPNHVLAVELRKKAAEGANGIAGPVEYVVNLYDPNLTALHERLVVSDLDLLREKGLGALDRLQCNGRILPHEQRPPDWPCLPMVRSERNKAPGAGNRFHHPHSG